MSKKSSHVSNKITHTKKVHKKQEKRSDILKFGRMFFCTLMATCTLLYGGNTTEASTLKQVAPIGRAVGIKLFSDGVVVVGMSPITTDHGEQQPAKEAGIKIGDILTHINGTEVDTIESVQEMLKEADDQPMALAVLRAGKELQISAVAVDTGQGEHKLGLWLRDSMAGIGTMTFYDPETDTYAALGHGVNDVDTAQIMPLESGAILYADVADVEKGYIGSPGQLQGAFDVTRELGDLRLNSNLGIYGKISTTESEWDTYPLMDVADFQEIMEGEATILSNVTGDSIQEYTIRIAEIYPETSGENRNMMIEITDERLLDLTGGIVQGMSGSPILQQDKIVGAVTHVLVNDPTRGYGVYIGNMLQMAETIDFE